MRPTLPSHLKLFALPLSRSLNHAKASPAFYLHAKKPPPDAVKSGSVGYVTRATNKAADMWSKLGQANEGTWKRRAYATGEKFMDRIEYEEWSLKAIDTELAPKPWTAIKESVGAAGVGAGAGAEKKGDDGKVDLLYPASLLSPGPLLDSLKSQLAHREPHHKSAMIKCLVGAPLTFPFALIPVIPNFPLFFVLWRAWSHWRAWKASKYLNSLLSSSQISLTPSASLDTIYSSSKSNRELLLTEDKVPQLVKTFGLSEDEGGELRRAVQQSMERLKQSNESKEKEKEATEKEKEKKE